MKYIFCIILFCSIVHAQGGMMPGPGTVHFVSGGTITKDNECTSGAFAVTVTDTCTMTLGAGVKNVVVSAGAISTTRTVVTVTVGATSCSRSNSQIISGSGTLEQWVCASPSTGSQIITVTWSVGAVNTTMIADSWTGGTGSFGTGVAATGTTTPASVSVTSATGHIVVDSKYRDQGTCIADTPGVGQTQFTNTQCLNSNGSLTGSFKAGAASVTNTWTLGANSNWGEVGVDLF